MIAESSIRDVMPRAVALRNGLHQIPELGFSEYKTAAAIRAELARLGISFPISFPVTAARISTTFRKAEKATRG